MGYVITCAVKKSCRPSKGPAPTRPPIKRGPWRLPVNSPKGGNFFWRSLSTRGAPKKRGAGRAKSWAKRERRAAFRAATGMVDLHYVM